MDDQTGHGLIVDVDESTGQVSENSSAMEEEEVMDTPKESPYFLGEVEQTRGMDGSRSVSFQEDEAGSERRMSTNSLRGGDRTFDVMNSPFTPLSRCESCGSGVGSLVPSEPSRWSPGGLRKTRCNLCRSLVSIKCCAAVSLVLAILFFATAYFLPAVFDKLLAQEIEKSLGLDSVNAAGYESFLSNADSDDFIFVHIHINDYVNPDEILRGKKPAIVQRGPFVYKVRMQRYNISWTDNNELINYLNHQWYEFMPDMSVSDDRTTKVRSINLGFLAVYAIVISKLPSWLREPAYQIAYKHAGSQSLFLERPVRELLFGYYDDRLLNSDGEPSHVEHRDEVESNPIYQSFAAQVEEKKNNFPGLLKNQSYEEWITETGLYAMHTGKWIEPLMHYFDKVEGSQYSTTCMSLSCTKKQLEPLWATAEANRVGGSDGEHFDVSKIKNHDPLEMFFVPIRTKVQITVADDCPKDCVVESIETVKYHLSPRQFENATVNPENAAYYAFGPNGMFNFSRLALGIPIMTSKPMFLDAEDYLHEAIAGLDERDREKYDTIIHLHSLTGVPIVTHQRLQFNVHLEPLDVGLTRFMPKLKPVYAPIFWLEIREKLSKEHKDLFHLCDFAKDVVRVVHSGSYVLGSIAILVAIVNSAVHSKRTKKVELKKRRSSLYQHLLHESGDVSPYFMNHWIERPELFSHPHMQKAMFLTTLGCFMVNMAIELVTNRNVSNLGMIEPLPNGPNTSVLIQVALTATLVSFFTSIGACFDAKAAVEFGYFPTLRWEMLYAPKWDLKKDPWLFFLYPVHRLDRYIVIALVCSIWYGLLFGIPAISICFIVKTFFHVDKVNVELFAFIKATFAAIEAFCVFVPIYMKTAASRVAPLHSYVSQGGSADDLLLGSGSSSRCHPIDEHGSFAVVGDFHDAAQTGGNIRLNKDSSRHNSAMSYSSVSTLE